jgi:hypothetical protein
MKHAPLNSAKVSRLRFPPGFRVVLRDNKWWIQARGIELVLKHPEDYAFARLAECVANGILDSLVLDAAWLQRDLSERTNHITATIN